MKPSLRFVLPASALAVVTALSAAVPELKPVVEAKVNAEYPSLEAIYKNLHEHPELSLMEVNTAALLAKELRALGFEVTEKVGNTGVVAVMKNGPGPTVLVRADMDALPIKEATGLPYASTAVVKDFMGRDMPAMHACAHDTHVTGLIGTARVLAALKDRWSGTLVLIGQPAEEIVVGARAMLSDGLYTRFPKPDYALGLHTWAQLPAGVVGYAEGPFMAAAGAVDITVHGVSGHGSSPHLAKDPVVLAAEIVNALQTIVSREIKPGTTAVITVGSIHGGTKRNIIPDEVKMEITLRAFDDEVIKQMIASIRRICAGLGASAGLAGDKLPTVTEMPDSIGVTSNNPALTRRVSGVLTDWLGADRVKAIEPVTGAEDFSLYGKTLDHIPTTFWFIGGTAPGKLEEAKRTGVPVPTNHNFGFAPVPEPTIKAAVESMSAAVLDLLQKK